MLYRPLGRTGLQVSALGLGAMRLPGFEDPTEAVDEEKARAALAIAHRAFDLGVNYIDTAYIYASGNNERIVGRILRGYRDRVYLATKSPVWHIKGRPDYRRFLEEQLARLAVDCLDFYYFHDVNARTWPETILKYDLLEEAQRAKEEGLIRHVSLSSHAKPDLIAAMIDTGVFATVLLQYNLLDRSNEEAIAYAREKGLGVLVMGPVAGGQLAAPSEVIAGSTGRKFSGTAEVALRFALANPDVSCVLSGMSSLAMVEENARLASLDRSLDAEDWSRIETLLAETGRLRELYCTGCGYCQPCPNGIDIPNIFKQLLHHRVWGLTEAARKAFAEVGRVESAGAPPSACTECGVCETRCPQGIKIGEQLKQAERELG